VTTRLSSRLTDWYRIGAPLTYLTGIFMVKFVAPNLILIAAIGMIASMAYTIWYGWRLSDVWLDGDTLQVKGLATFRVPLSDVSLTDVQKRGRGSTIYFLGLDHPVGKVKTIRFIPAGDIEMDLRRRLKKE
jgi:hypothetical protein